MDCIFCKIAAGEIPANIVYQDKDFVAFKDINPQAPVHDVLIPRVHIPSIAEASPDRAELLGRWLLTAPKVAEKEKIDKTGYRIIINYGEDARLVVHHLHLHVIGGKKLRG
jgi:histidine triad (HIT) family protein